MSTLDKNEKPEALAVWNLRSLHQLCEDYIYGAYHDSPHSGLHDRTPHQVFKQGLPTGNHDTRPSLDQSSFELDSLPHSARTEAVVHAGRGILHRGFEYWCKEFEDQPADMPPVQVKWDPLDFTHIYVLVRGKWTECFCSDYKRYKQLSASDLQIVTSEIYARRTRTRSNSSATCAIEKFSLSMEELEEKLKKRFEEKGGCPPSKPKENENNHNSANTQCESSDPIEPYDEENY